MEINKSKSAIVPMLLNHEKMPKEKSFNGYEFAESYKYLGVKFNNKFSPMGEILVRQKKTKQTYKQLYAIANSMKDFNARNMIFTSLGFAKTSYMSEILAVVDTKAH